MRSSDLAWKPAVEQITCTIKLENNVLTRLCEHIAVTSWGTEGARPLCVGNSTGTRQQIQGGKEWCQQQRQLPQESSTGNLREGESRWAETPQGCMRGLQALHEGYQVAFVSSVQGSKCCQLMRVSHGCDRLYNLCAVWSEQNTERSYVSFWEGIGESVSHRKSCSSDTIRTTELNMIKSSYCNCSNRRKSFSKEIPANL